MLNKFFDSETAAEQAALLAVTELGYEFMENFSEVVISCVTVNDQVFWSFEFIPF